MANSDASQYVLRYNEISGAIEAASAGNWTQVTLANLDGITQLTGDVTAGPGSGSQAATIAAGAVTAAKIASGTITTTQISASAAIAYSQLAALTSAHILVGNGSNVATSVAVSGDVTLANTGAVTVATVGGQTAAAINGSVILTNSATQNNNASSLVFRDNTGSFAASTITVSKALVQNVSTPAGTGTVTPDGTLGPTYEITVSGALTLNGPSSPVNGQKVTFVIHNDASHAVTLATGAGNFTFGTDITSYTNSVSKTDLIGAIYNTTANRWYVVSIIQGF